MTGSAISSDIFRNAMQAISSAKNCLITTHTKPDGDACGAVAAIAETLISLKKDIKPLFLSIVPEWYRFLLPGQMPVLEKDVPFSQLKQGQFGKFDLVIIVDTNSRSQLPKFDEYLKSTATPVLIIDHHATSDSLGTVEVVDSSAAATCSIALDLFRYAGWPITPRIAAALFTGIATDTGWFHFSNTDARSLRDCAELVEAGAKPAEIYRAIYQTFTLGRFKLLTALLSSLQLQLDGRYAAVRVTQKDFQQTGSNYEDTENLIDECQRIASVEVSALFAETRDNRIRCSLRSRGGVDVCKIARKFDGGGHRNAAGTYLPSPMEAAANLILDAVKQELHA